MSMPESQTIQKARRQILAQVAVAVVVTLASGYLYGNWTQRWGKPADMQAAADHLATMPKEFGSWRLVDESQLPKPVADILECAGNIQRRYVDQESGATVDVALIVGPPGPTAVHTPEICYSSRTHEITKSSEKVLISSNAGEPHSFWRMNLTPRDPSADPLVVYYAWNGGEKWTASNSPRFEFGGGQMLHKIQLSASVDSRSAGGADDPCKNFLNSLARCGWAVSQPQSPL